MEPDSGRGPRSSGLPVGHPVRSFGCTRPQQCRSQGLGEPEQGQGGEPEDECDDRVSMGLLPRGTRARIDVSPGTCHDGEKIAERVVRRLSDQDYGAPKVLAKMGAVYFNAKISPHLWKDESDALDLSVALRRFPQWTYLPILPNREETLRACIREGVSQGLWAVAIGDTGTNKYQALIEKPESLDDLAVLFDGSASLVKGDMLQLVRDELRPTEAESGGAETKEVEEATRDGGQFDIEEHVDPGKGIREQSIPPPAKRLTRVRLDFADLAVAKTNNLQPYLFRVLQDQDAGAEVSLTIEVTSDAGISQDALDQRIVEAFDQLGIAVRWEEG